MFLLYEVLWLRLFHEKMQKRWPEAQTSVFCRITIFWNIWQFWSLILRLQKKIYYEVLWLQFFHKYGITEKKLFPIFFLLIFWNKVYVLCFSRVHLFSESLLIYNSHNMKVLGLQLFIDDIIGSCNFTTFSIMTSTRAYYPKVTVLKVVTKVVTFVPLVTKVTVYRQNIVVKPPNIMAEVAKKWLWLSRENYASKRHVRARETLEELEKLTQLNCRRAKQRQDRLQLEWENQSLKLILPIFLHTQ